MKILALYFWLALAAHYTTAAQASYSSVLPSPAATPSSTPDATAKTGRDVFGHPLGIDVQGNPNDKNAQGSRPKDVQGHPPEDIYGNKTGSKQ